MNTFSHKGTLKLGEIEIDCYVLEGGQTAVSQRGAAVALGFKQYTGGGQLGSLLGSIGKKGHDTEHLRTKVDGGELTFSAPQAGGNIKGISGETFAEIVSVVTAASAAGDLKKSQEHIGRQCAKVLGVCSVIGVAALIREAAGYIVVKDSEKLAVVAQNWLAKQPNKPQKTVPDDFYKYLYEAMGWSRLNPPNRHGSAVARHTADIVYSRLAPGILEELRVRNPIQPNGARKFKHHQFMERETAYLALAQRISDVTLLLKFSGPGGWPKFYAFLTANYPVQRADSLDDLSQDTPEDLLARVGEDLENAEIEDAEAATA